MCSGPVQGLTDGRDWSDPLRKGIWFWLAADLIIGSVVAVLAKSDLGPALVAAVPPILYFSWMVGVESPDAEIIDVQVIGYPRSLIHSSIPDDEGSMRNAIFLNVQIRNVGNLTLREAAVEVRLHGVSTEAVSLHKGRWAPPSNPEHLDLHPGDVQTCTLLTVRLDDLVPEVPTSRFPQEDRARALGKLDPGAWSSSQMPSDEYNVVVEIVGEDYTSIQYNGTVTLPDDLISFVEIPRRFRDLKGRGVTIEWKAAGQDIQTTDAEELREVILEAQDGSGQSGGDGPKADTSSVNRGAADPSLPSE